MPDVKEVINGLEMSYKYSNVDENNTLVPQWIVLHALALLKVQEPVVHGRWIHCKGKSHIWYCSNCGGKVNYNNAHKVYTKDMKPIGEVNRFCRNCGAKMDGESHG